MSEKHAGFVVNRGGATFDDVLRLMRSVGFGDLEITTDPAGIPRVVYGRLYDEI